MIFINFGNRVKRV
jgi:hypothetical protein